jgi:hypothetical protein
MIQAAGENKYGFNMQVSAPAMAGAWVARTRRQEAKNGSNGGAARERPLLKPQSPIGVRYTRIRNLYLFCGPLSPSEAPRSAACRS